VAKLQKYFAKQWYL